MMDMDPLFDLEPYQDEAPTVKEDEPDMLAVYLGQEQAVIVRQALGGLTFRMPSAPTGERYRLLEKKLGTELANKLMTHFANEELYIPRQHQAEVELKHRLIRQRYNELVQRISNVRAIQELALEYELSDRQIRRILYGRNDR